MFLLKNAEHHLPPCVFPSSKNHLIISWSILGLVSQPSTAHVLVSNEGTKTSPAPRWVPRTPPDSAHRISDDVRTRHARSAYRTRPSAKRHGIILRNYGSWRLTHLKSRKYWAESNLNEPHFQSLWHATWEFKHSKCGVLGFHCVSLGCTNRCVESYQAKLPFGRDHCWQVFGGGEGGEQKKRDWSQELLTLKPNYTILAVLSLIYLICSWQNSCWNIITIRYFAGQLILRAHINSFSEQRTRGRSRSNRSGCVLASVVQ